MFRQLFSRRNDTDKRISDLIAQREAAAERIRQLRTEIDALVDQAVCADDLDTKILSLDYESRKTDLAAEMERFKDITAMIARLRNVEVIESNRRRIERVTQLGETIDIETLHRKKDEIQIRRDMMREAQEDVEDMKDLLACEPDSIDIDEEFSRRIAQARQSAANEFAVQAENCVNIS